MIRLWLTAGSPARSFGSFTERLAVPQLASRPAVPEAGQPGTLQVRPTWKKMSSLEDQAFGLLNTYSNGFMVSQVGSWE